jgi:hypothetical protein
MRALFVIGCVAAAAVPLVPGREPDAPEAVFPGWPGELDARPLSRLPDSEQGVSWSDGLPGRVARFTDGEREIVIRWVVEVTRKLHPARSCFRGIGYAVTPLPDAVDGAGRRWGTFRAEKNGERLRVRESIRDAAGRTWSDQSDWYWSAMLGRTRGPWWVVVVAERQ